LSACSTLVGKSAHAVEFSYFISFIPFRAFTLLVGQQEGHQACKKPPVVVKGSVLWNLIQSRVTIEKNAGRQKLKVVVGSCCSTSRVVEVYFVSQLTASHRTGHA